MAEIMLMRDCAEYAESEIFDNCHMDKGNVILFVIAVLYVDEFGYIL